MKGCKHLFYSSHRHYSFNKHCLMFKHNVLKWDAGSYTAFNCQKCLLGLEGQCKQRNYNFQQPVFILLLTELLGEIPEILHIREDFYSQKFTCIAILMKILYTFSLNPSLYHLIVLKVWSITSTSSSHFFTAQKDLIQCRETARFYLLNVPVLTQQNI